MLLESVQVVVGGLTRLICEKEMPQPGGLRIAYDRRYRAGPSWAL